MGQQKSKHSYNVANVEADTANVRRQSAKSTSLPVVAAIIEAKPTPEWINQQQFVDILRHNIAEFSHIQSFRVAAKSAAENHEMLMLSVSIDVQLNDKSVKPVCYVMKVPQDGANMQQMLSDSNVVTTENVAYRELIPEFEKLYKAKGLQVKFAPRAYEFSGNDAKLANTVLMEDLEAAGFKNLSRVQCLNKEQTKMVLRKLAQFHAASAQYAALHGPYATRFLNDTLHTDRAAAIAKIEAMLDLFKSTFLASLRSYKHGEQYHEKFMQYFDKISNEFWLFIEHDPQEFNVLNHGDCWMNNLLFKQSLSGEQCDMLFVDFQNPKYGSPAQDLLFFIMSSVHIDHKLKDFEYFIHYYYDNLVEQLRLLGYAASVPSLRQLHKQLYKYGSWAVNTSVMLLPVVLLDESANTAHFVADSKNGQFTSLMYANKRYREYFEKILPWLDDRGLLVVDNPPQHTAAETAVDEDVPAWLNGDYLSDMLRQQKSDFKSIQSFRVKKATAGGDNYTSLLLTIDVVYLTSSEEQKSASYMLKLPNDCELTLILLDKMQTFKRELAMYTEVIPQLEQLYREAGRTVVFAPQSYAYSQPSEGDHILLENLRPLGFRNADRLSGLTTNETECVLRKLAELHAASAHYYALKGRAAYADTLMKTIYTEENRQLFEEMAGQAFIGVGIESLQTYTGNEAYREKVTYMIKNLFELTAKMAEYTANGFNVINHGDCWTNNIMFQYDDAGNIVDTYLIDYQNSNFGSPTQDLYYLLISSPSLDIKLDKFDYFLRYYQQHLQQNLELLQYPHGIPSIKDLQIDMLKNGFWAVSTMCTVTPSVLVDPTDNATIANMLGSNEDGINFKLDMFQNERYRKHAEAVYTWLNHRGLLDIEDSSAQPKQEVNWLDFHDFADIIAAEVPEFDRVLGGTACLATKPGDNYASKLLKVDIKAALKDQQNKTYSYILKVLPAQEGMALLVFNMFPKENEMYAKYIPAFEQLYQDIGLSIKFTAKSYRFNREIKDDYLLMENLNTHGFKMGNRQEGLDIEHTKCVLKKLAQWHAVSLRYKELHGPYPVAYNAGMINEHTRDIFVAMIEPGESAFLASVQDITGVEEYHHKLGPIVRGFTDNVIAEGKRETDFKVLNHGDAWLNNIMFQYDDSGHIKETLLIDHQVAVYGSPAQDLYYFLMSSAELNIKVDKFDYLIRWYHENLVEHAKLLKYTGYVPDLKELNILLLKHAVYAAGTVFTTLTICLADANDGLTLENFMAEGEAAEQLSNSLYSNQRFRQHFELIMPWLNKRGLLDMD